MTDNSSTLHNALQAPGAVATTGGPRLLWALIGVLGASTLALGAALLQTQTQPKDLVSTQTVSAPQAASTAPVWVTEAASPVVAAPVAPVIAPIVAPAVAPTVPEIASKPVLAPPPIAKTPAARINNATAASKTVAHHSGSGSVAAVPSPSSAERSTHAAHDAKAAGTPAPAGPVAAGGATAKAVCAHCGTVVAVTPMERESEGGGVGAVAGAVLGGLVGNQVGGGDGKTLATIVGVLGGGWAGNAVEKRMKKQTYYEIDVRMEDGSRQRIEQSTLVAVGSRVTVQGGVIRIQRQDSVTPSAPASVGEPGTGTIEDL